MGSSPSETNLPPAPDVPPENNFDIQSWMQQAKQSLDQSGATISGGGVRVHSEPGFLLKELLAGLGMAGDALGLLMAVIGSAADPILRALLKAVLTILEPAVEVGGDLTKAFVSVLVSSLTGVPRAGESAGQYGATPAAQMMFDSVMAPLAGLSSAKSPNQDGAGIANAQYALGGIIAIHLHTWVLNIIANFTGAGYLKFINSFDAAVTSCLNSRSLGRGAMKPYLNMFIANPLTRDLNSQMPLEIGSTGQLVKRYVRGNMTNEELKKALRGRGYDDDVVADMLLDTIHFLSVAQITELYRNGTWQIQDAIDALTHQGYSTTHAAFAIEYELGSLVRSERDATASALVTARGNWQIDNETLRASLQKMNFRADEIEALALHGAMIAELPHRLTLSQVKGMYEESIVDLDYVLQFLHDEQYSDDDADKLTLWYFTTKERRDDTRAILAARRRVQADAAAAKAAKASADQQADLLKLQSALNAGA